MHKLACVLLLIGASVLVPGSQHTSAQGSLPELTGRLFYFSDRTGGPTLWVTDLDRNETRLVADFTARFSSVGSLEVSPDGERLVFNACAAIPYDWSYNEIWLINTDGSGLRQLTDWHEWRTTSEHAPVWSPTELDVIYYFHDLNWDGYPRRLNVDTMEDTAVPRLVPGSPWYMDITNDGASMVVVGEEREFTVGVQPNATTYSQRLDGSEWHRLKEPNGRIDGWLDLNRGDGWIVFVEATNEGWRPTPAIWKMDPDGGSIQLLAEPLPGRIPHHASWAGTRHDRAIVMVASIDGNQELVAMRALPGEWPANIINLTNSPGSEWSPAWTPIPSTPVDTTPPQISWIVEGTPGGNGWYTSAVTVTWTVSDPESAYTTDGCEAQSVTVDTSGITYTCSASSAGGPASASVTIKRDTTPPTVACSATPTVLWPANHKLWDASATATASDANAWTLTGLDILSSEADSGLGRDDVPNDIQGFAAGTTTSGQLRAERYSKPGRTYTLNFTVADDAGNTGTCATSVTVPHDQGNGKRK